MAGGDHPAAWAGPGCCEVEAEEAEVMAIQERKVEILHQGFDQAKSGFLYKNRNFIYKEREGGLLVYILGDPPKSSDPKRIRSSTRPCSRSST